MAKVAFTKLGLKKNEEIVTFEYNGNKIEVKQYLPVDEKLELITRVLTKSHDDENNFSNPIRVDVIGTIEIIKAYANITFTEKQEENIGKLYDLLDSNGLVNQIINAIPKAEYEFLINGIDETIKSVYQYRNSVLGVLDTISTDYKDLSLEAETIQKNLSDPNNMTLLKDVLTKLG